MNPMRKTVLLAALALLGAWIAANYSRLTGDQHGMVRFVLGGLFAALVLVRPKPKDTPAPGHRAAWLGGSGAAGAVLAVGGIIFTVHQYEWLGIMLLLYACLRWSLPNRYAGDILRALLLLYWIHPLPGQIFGPLQLAMQRWSLAGAEWVLHGMNVRVWADGLYLYTGFDTIGVPESCSGMRTAFSVLLCGLGVGLLFRFHVIELVVLLLTGLAQVLALNVARISAVVKLAPTMPPEWSDNVLHDQLGWFLLVAIVLVQIEAAAWQVWKGRLRRRLDGIARQDLEPPERATRLPRFWSLFFRWARLLVVLSVLAMVIVLAVYKSRPAHREQMRRDVIEGLLETNREVAERAIARSLQRKPNDLDLLAKKARVQVMRRDFQGALATFNSMPGPLSPLETTLKSWSLMALGRAPEAVAQIDALSEEERRLPGVAMVRAEYAAIQDDPELASHYIVFAGNSTIAADRVRALFPFLARHEQWAAIAGADSDQPYQDVSQALIAAHACLRVNNLDGAARAMRHALHQWGEDPRFLRNLFVLASRRPGGEWEDRFAANFTANYAKLDAEQIVPYITYCFQLSRPDLAWLAYLHLLAIDARHPDVFYTPAQFGSRWYGFRRHAINVGGGDRDATIDLRPLAAHTRYLWPLNRLWAHVPLEQDLTRASLGQVRDRYMKWTLAELQAREQDHSLSRRGELIFPSVLASEGRFDEAHKRLDDIRAKYPIFTPQVLLEHAEFFDQEKRWDEAYEALREYYMVTDLVELQAELLMVNALLNLNLAVQAMDVANHAATMFPGVGYTDLLRAAIWDIFGFKDQALFVLGDHEDDLYLHTAARLNAETGRLREADRTHKVLGLSFDPRAVGKRQTLLPVPAEMVITRRWPKPMLPEEIARELERCKARMAADKSPFMKALDTLTAAWYEAPHGADPASLQRWRAAGRDTPKESSRDIPEKATALHRLAVLLARARQYDQAALATRAALGELPKSALLHRILIALTEGEPVEVQAARDACPDDPEIWLASLVAGVRTQGTGTWAMASCQQAVKAGLYSPDALVRGGDYLLRNGMLEEASYLARQAVENKRTRGLISAYMLGLRCALEKRDAEWALHCARLGIDHAVDPALFYRAIVEIKTIQATPDADLVTALEYLKEHFPKDPEWVQYLGHLYFQRGDSQRALTLLEPLISQELAGVRVRSLLLAAEAARVSGYDAKAIGILERTLALHPDQMSILNNLIYNLSQHPDTAPRARELLPRLLEINSESFAVLDTAAMVYLRSGDVDRAREYMDRAMARLDENGYGALETRLNSAEVLLAQGLFDEARIRIDEVRRDTRINDLDYIDARARRLLDEVQRREAQP